jgi:prepilin-type N-terminal cleavage/methylation domain-containing protein
MFIKSFTLIELLVVIAIIGILAGIIVVSMGSAQGSANDARRKTDVNQLSKSIMIHKVDHPETPLPIETCSIGGGTTPCSSAVLSVLNNASVLRDPDSSKYYYYSSTDGNHYTVSTKLSDSNDYCFDSSTGKYGTCIFSGEWIDTGLGFQVMKYEARNVDGKANSTPEGVPWGGISQTQAILECNRIGAHLITNTEWTALARHIAAQPSNWSNGAVGDGVLSRGYSASTTYASDGFTNTGPAPTTGTLNDVYNTGVNAVGPNGVFDLKRTHYLVNGQIIWDLAGNLWEWNSDTCIPGSGEGNWYNSGTWIEWNDTNLDDYERLVGGSIQPYTSQNLGSYYGCTANGRGFLRGGTAYTGQISGIFAINLYHSPLCEHGEVGFRCAR